MSVYYTDATNLAVGCTMRLVIVPYNENHIGPYDATYVQLDGRAVLEFGELNTSFKDLPFGIQEPQKMKIKALVDMFPPALLAKLEEGEAPTVTTQTLVGGSAYVKSRLRNAWYFYTDRDNPGTFSLEFVGVQSSVGGAAYEYDEKSGLTTCEYELIDAFYVACTLISGDTLAALMQAKTVAYAATSYDQTTEIGQSASSSTLNRGGVVDMRPATVAEIESVITSYFEKVMDTTTCRTGVVAVTLNQPIMTTACEFYDNASPRAKGSVLTDADLLLPAEMLALTWNLDYPETYSTQVVGGYASDNDALGMKNVKTAWDWLVDYAKTFAVKITYTFSWNGGTSTVGCALTCERVADGASYTAPINKAKKGGIKFQKGANVARYCEVRINPSDDAKNTTAWVYPDNNASNGEQSLPITCKIHNNPLAKYRIEGSGNYDVYADNMSDNNMLFYEDGSGSIVKVYDACRIYWDATNYVELSSTLSDTTPTFSDDDESHVDQWNAQIVAIQQACGLPATLAYFGNHVFGRMNQTAFELEWPIRGNLAFLTLGSIHDLTGFSSLSGVNFAVSVVTALSYNWKEGTCKAKYLTLPS